MKNEQFIETFKEEALELLSSLESILLDLEKDPQDPELLSAVFRVMHTIKGSAGMFGLEAISSFAHEVESILSALRDGKLKVSRTLIGNTLLARDYILSFLDNVSTATEPLDQNMLSFLDEFKKDVGFAKEQNGLIEKKGPILGVQKKEPEKPKYTWHIVFFPSINCFRRGGNPLGIIPELQSLGELTYTPLFSRIDFLETLNPEECKIGWDFYLSTSASENEIRDVFIFEEDSAEISFECLEHIVDEKTNINRKLGEILVSEGKLDQETLFDKLKNQKRIGELLVEEKIVSNTDIKVALESQKQLQKVQKQKISSVEMSTIRVKSEKLDLLMSLVGELVTVHARILETSKNIHNDELLSVVEQFGRLTDDLRNNTMSIRMVPVGSTFSSFKRLVRDLALEMDKKVELVTEGGETELDKTVIEKLNDPLVHIIRNSLDHGIETPDIRLNRGKTEQGTIRLSASQTGASVYIDIEDDGNGLNKEAILKKALKNGLVKEDAVLSEEDVFNLIFAPGFSTKETVSSVSGRGVGMDVVHRQMEMINGSVSIKSESLKGTKITLKIPLTLAIIDSMLVKISDSFFVVPLSVVDGCMEFIKDNQTNEHDIVIFHDKQLPFVNMRDFFSIEGERKKIEQIVIVNIKGQRVGILVDQVVGGNQTVIKPLGKLFKQAEGISSGTILGDGSVALILDVEQIVDSVEKDKT